MSRGDAVAGVIAVLRSREQRAYAAWLTHTISCGTCQPSTERCPDGDQLHGALRQARREARR